jgi:hypothetical protein
MFPALIELIDYPKENYNTFMIKSDKHLEVFPRERKYNLESLLLNLGSV